MADDSADQFINQQQEIIRKQNAMLQEMAEKIAAIEAQLPQPEPAPLQPGQRLAWPKCVYRPGGLPTQIDHPGFEVKHVHSEAQMDAAVADGWSSQMVAPPVHKGKR